MTTDPSNYDLGALLKLMVDVDASDLFLTVGAPPNIKVQGVVRAINLPPMTSPLVKSLAYSIMTEAQTRQFEAHLECDLGITIENLGRFRFNIFMQRGETAVVARRIKTRIPTIQTLKLPEVLEHLVMLKRGLILVVGSAGAGKSSTLAAMLEHRNENATGHILTIEDPIEFVHQHKRSLIDQREVGLDTHSFEEALRHAMREAPDLIMIGEIRDQMTMQHAISYAETGHLCLSTLHANNANQTIDRIINFFPEDSRRQILMDLSMNLRAVIAQRLIRGNGDQLVPATEVLVLTPYISELIQKGQTDQIKDLMSKGQEVGMHTFDQSLYDLYARGEISMEQAIENADSKTDLSLRIRLTPGHQPASPDLHLKPENAAD
ncbi:PilT/PilU family type 4a pilus ATPase [Fluviicoccus keumensis]|nr:PilT/PilU family type 4a pilus ATPase [Fluviicoccus keumensis]